jgi:hypothetical protein
MPQTACVTGIRVIWYGHLHCKGGYPSLLARHYRPHGHSDELSHDEHRSYARPGIPNTAIADRPPFRGARPHAADRVDLFQLALSLTG